jgi:hypothetical protein
MAVTFSARLLTPSWGRRPEWPFRACDGLIRRALGQIRAMAGHSAWSPDATTTQLAAKHGRGGIAVQDWTEQAASGDRRGTSERSRGVSPGKGSPCPHSTRITEGLGRGRPPLQKKAQEMNEA